MSDNTTSCPDTSSVAFNASFFVGLTVGLLLSFLVVMVYRLRGHCGNQVPSVHECSTHKASPPPMSFAEQQHPGDPFSGTSIRSPGEPVVVKDVESANVAVLCSPRVGGGFRATPSTRIGQQTTFASSASRSTPRARGFKSSSLSSERTTTTSSSSGKSDASNNVGEDAGQSRADSSSSTGSTTTRESTTRSLFRRRTGSLFATSKRLGGSSSSGKPVDILDQFHANDVGFFSVERFAQRPYHLDTIPETSIAQEDPVLGAIQRILEEDDSFQIDPEQLELGKVIGKGGSGRIFRAKYCGSEVAVKEILSGNINVPNGNKDDFVGEFTKLRKLRHPHIITLFGAAVLRSSDSGEPRFLLVTERARCSLRDYLDSDEAISFSDAVKMGGEIATGGAFIHSMKIIHFDIKPGNVLLDSSQRLKICDLGISKLCSSTDQLLVQTMTSVHGTPAYMAPEMFQHDFPNISYSVDVYSWSLVLWELLHRRKPYPTNIPIAKLISLIIQDNYRPAVGPLTPCRLRNLMYQCWNTEPANRPSFEQVLGELSLATLDIAEDVDKRFHVDQVVGVWYLEEDWNDDSVGSDSTSEEEVDNADVPTPALVQTRSKSNLPGMLSFARHRSSSSRLQDEPSAAKATVNQQSSSQEQRVNQPDLDDNTFDEDWGGMKSRPSKSGFTWATVLEVVDRSYLKVRRCGNEQDILHISPENAFELFRGGNIPLEQMKARNFFPLDATPAQSLMSECPRLRRRRHSSVGSDAPESAHGDQTFNVRDGEVEIQDIKISEQGMGRGHGSIFNISNICMLEEIGRGASGQVFKAIHLRTFELIAVKSVPVFDQASRRQLYKELIANKAHKLESSREGQQNVMDLLGVFYDPGDAKVKILMEYMDCGSCQDLIEQGSIPSEALLAGIAMQVLVALTFLHDDCNRLHRDIKPANILLSSQGVARLADFGLARQLDINPEDERNQAASTFLGTMSYMSPERLRGEEYSFPSDVWALGACLLDISRPPDNQRRRGKQRNIFELIDGNSSLSASSSCSDVFKSFIEQCTKLDPSERPSAAQLLEHEFIRAHQTNSHEAIRAYGETRRQSPGPEALAKLVSRLITGLTTSKTDTVVGDEGPAIHMSMKKLRYLADQINVPVEQLKRAIVNETV